jgi:hemolysin III
MSSKLQSSPVVTAERLADGVVQGLNVILAIVGCLVLCVLASSHLDAPRTVALAMYVVGLLAMVGCSALYGWGRGSRRHLLFRDLDQAAIFLMIAGTYAPFGLIQFGGTRGLRLMEIVWSLALAGLLLRLAAPRRFEALSVPLYLAMGWGLLSDPGLLLTLPVHQAVWLLAGGLLYTGGIAFHLGRMPFQEAIWHSFVLAAAACQYVAVLSVLG